MERCRSSVFLKCPPSPSSSFSLSSLRSLPPTCSRFKQRCSIQRGFNVISLPREIDIRSRSKTTKDKLACWLGSSCRGNWGDDWWLGSRSELFNAWNVVGRERIRGFIYHVIGIDARLVDTRRDTSSQQLETLFFFLSLNFLSQQSRFQREHFIARKS